MRLSDIYQTINSTLTEVSMAPSSLQQWAKSPVAAGMLMGFEAEMCVPNVQSDNDGDMERDYDTDERASSIDSIIDFFSDGPYASLDRLDQGDVRETMENAFNEWQSDKMEEYINDNESELHDKIRQKMKEEFDYNEVEEEAQAEIDSGTVPEDEDIDDVKRRLGNAAIDKIIERQQGPGWNNAYDYARGEMQDKYRDNSWDDEDDWLNDIGVESMSDAENEWNLGWPHYTNTWGGGDTEIDEVAEDLKYALGNVPMVTGSSYHGADRNGTDWIIEPDTSIDTDDHNDAGLEIISPPLPLSDSLMYLQKTKEWASGYGCYTNDSTGLHINISVPNFSVETLDYVKLAIFMGDKHILEEFGRRSNTYCKSAIDIVKRRAEEPGTAVQVMAKMREQLNTEASKMIHGGITEKFTSINVRSGWVEFRGPGGDYLDKPIDVLVNTTLRLAMALSIACDETLYKQEYAKKLYKMIAPTANDGSTDAIGLFARYMSASIDKTELKDTLRNLNKARADAKNPKIAAGQPQYWTVYRTSAPMQKIEVSATGPADALAKAQQDHQYGEAWSRIRDDQFTIVPTNRIPEKLPARAPLDLTGEPSETLPQYKVTHIPTGRSVIFRSNNPQYAIQHVATTNNLEQSDLTAVPV